MAPGMTPTGCPCGSGSDYVGCCKPIHERGAGLGRSAETLMRARFCAFVQCNEAFLLASWHPSTRPPSVQFDPALRWTGLEIVATVRGTGLDADGIVEFVARFEIANHAGEQRERSRFTRVDGTWNYVDGLA